MPGAGSSGHEAGELLVEAARPAAVQVQVEDRVEAAGDREQVALDAARRALVVAERRDVDRLHAAVAVRGRDALAQQHLDAERPPAAARISSSTATRASTMAATSTPAAGEVERGAVARRRWT